MKKIPPQLESDVLNEVCQYLKNNNYFFWRANNIAVFGKNNAGNMTFRSMPKYSMRGVPDINIICKGDYIGVECKREGAQLSEYQKTFKRDVEGRGGLYVVVHSGYEMQLFLDNRGYEKFESLKELIVKHYD